MKRVTKSISIAAGILLTSAPWAAALGLPDPEPYLATDTAARQNTVLNVQSFPSKAKMVEQPCFEVGRNKVLCVRKIDGRNRTDQDQRPAIYIDGKQVLTFTWWGAIPNGSGSDWGYPFKDIEGHQGKLVTIDAKTGTVVFQKEYLAPDRSKRVFTYTLKALPDSKVELSWNIGVTSDEMAKMPRRFGASLWLLLRHYRGTRIVVGGKTFIEADRQTLIDRKEVATRVDGDFLYNPEAEAHGFKIGFDYPSPASMTEAIYVPKVGADRYSITYRQGHRISGRLTIDFGVAEVKKGVYPPVGGIDFWKNDDTHVPVSPVRNLMPNPSFEQGLRYWRYVGGGARYTPGEGPRYEISEQGLFGKHAMLIRDTQQHSASLETFPMALEKGVTYTLSFYARAEKNCSLNAALASAAKGGKFRGKYGILFGDSGTPQAKFAVTTEWQRFHRTFTADAAGLQIILSGGHNTLVDGLQLEKGREPTEFVAPPLDGLFTTADPDNFTAKGSDIGAGFTFTGKPGTRGTVNVTIEDAYREPVASKILQVEIPQAGLEHIPLPLDKNRLGKGIFLVRADYAAAGKKYTEYYRFSVMTALSNTHATKNIFGTLTGDMARIGRGEDLARKFMQWGFGSTSWGVSDDDQGHKVRAPLEKKFRIANFFGTAMPRHGENADILKTYKKWTKVPPELQKRIEEAAYEKVSHYDPTQYYTWAFGNEEEGSYLPGHKMFDEYFKAQSAAARGVKRANPKAIFSPTSGTSGYNRLRGYDAVEGYLKAAQKHHFRYDAVSVHPYGNIDKGSLSRNDLDEETARLVAQMKRYGYGRETPIYFTEMFNIIACHIPAWGANLWGDDYHAGKPTYDFGNREFIQAASVARIWIIALKYWPRLRSTNVWIPRPFLDYHFAPLLLCKVANTLGKFMPDVAFYGDIRPVVGVRGYSFKLKNGTGLAAIWCIDDDVENGLRRGPKVMVRFTQDVAFYDLMGNRRAVSPDKTGDTAIQLTPAPLLIKAGGVAALTTSLRKAFSNDSRSALKVAIQPALDGNIKAKLENRTGRVQSGVLQVAGKDIRYTLQPEKSELVTIPGEAVAAQFGKLYRWEHEIDVKPKNGAVMKQQWNMDFFYVPKTEGMPDWSKIPAIEMTNRYVSPKCKGTCPPDDQKARFKLAWDEEHLYLRVEAEDDHFVLSPELWKRGKADSMLYIHDGCLEVYFDTGADARSNHEKTYDDNDYRYDFSIGRNDKSGPGMVYRLREVNQQLAGGMTMPTKEEAAHGIKCDFERTDKGYTYTILFDRRYLEPIVLRPGFVSGFALYLHDKDNNDTIGCPKGLSLATQKDTPCDYRPYLWPLMILKQ